MAACKELNINTGGGGRGGGGGEKEPPSQISGWDGKAHAVDPRRPTVTVCLGLRLQPGWGFLPLSPPAVLRLSCVYSWKALRRPLPGSCQQRPSSHHAEAFHLGAACPPPSGPPPAAAAAAPSSAPATAASSVLERRRRRQETSPAAFARRREVRALRFPLLASRLPGGEI